MDELCLLGKHFLFIIDFKKRTALLLEETQIPSSGIYLDCGLFSNWPGVRNGRPVGEPFELRHPPDARKLRAMQERIEALQEKERAGYCYLANLCFRFDLILAPDFLGFLPFVQAAHRLYWPERFLCFSPEDFISIHSGRITTYPMKGTLSTDKPLDDLMLDPKETAEHHTVVDLLRNDLGRVARRVRVERFRYVEKVERQKGSLYQTSSEISGQLLPVYRQRYGSLLAELLPAGSVTGAPKEETLEILEELEDSPRDFFSGVGGFVRGEDLVSFVLIRFVDLKDHSYRCGAGITVYSNPLQECQEILDKIYVPFA